MTTAATRTILVVEDDQKIAALLCDYLKAAGFAPIAIADGRRAVTHMRTEDCPAAMILDLSLPGLDGIEVCKAVRKHSAVPIMMVTARVDEIDRLLGLETGADDYVCKPFSPKEVVARVSALIRRAEGRLVSGRNATPWKIDDAGQRIHWNGKDLALTPIEYRLLAAFLNHPGRVFARDRLLDSVHDDFRDVSDRAIDSHIKNIRRKIEQAAIDPSCIVSIYGVGYRFDPPEGE